MWTLFAHETGGDHTEPTSPLLMIGVAMLVVAGVIALRWYNSRKG